MASAADLKKRINDIKARPLLLIVGAVLLIGVIIIFFSIRRGNSNAIEENLTSKTTPVPNIRSTPGVGSTQDQTYNQLQLEQNRLRAEQAEQTGGSAVPTLVNQGNPSSIASLQAAVNPQDEYRRLLEEQNRRNAERAALQGKTVESSQQQQAQQAFEGLMQKQANELMKRWQPVNQVVVGGQVLDTAKMYTAQANASAAAGGANSAATKAKAPALYKAGDIVFGVLETGVNTDEPGPIMARIVSGPLKGSKLIGTLQRQNDKVMLTFNIINAEGLPNSTTVNMVAIDPDTARTALAGDVDNHYLLKYGAVFAGSFLQGVSQAVQSSLQPSFTASNNTFVATSTQATTKQEILVGLGQVGQQISQNIQQYSPPPTVTVDSGTSIGLLFLSDFSLTQGAELVGTDNKPAELSRSLSGLTSPDVASGTNPTVVVPTNAAKSVSSTTTTEVSNPLPGTVGPHNQSTSSTVSTTVSQGQAQ